MAVLSNDVIKYISLCKCMSYSAKFSKVFTDSSFLQTSNTVFLRSDAAANVLLSSPIVLVQLLFEGGYSTI